MMSPWRGSNLQSLVANSSTHRACPIPSSRTTRSAQRHQSLQQHTQHAPAPRQALVGAPTGLGKHSIPQASRTEASPTSSSSSSSSSSNPLASVDMSSVLSLTNIRNSLIRQEDTIIFNFIERAQFARDDAVYTPDAIPVPGFDSCGRRYSLLEYVLRETEQLHGKVRRYTSPDEQAFYPNDIPPLVLPPIKYEPVLAWYSPAINLNGQVMKAYLEQVLPGITTAGDDFNYGSAATLDVLVLQALSKRIHYGKFVAEAKFQAKPEQYAELIRARDADGIMELLTDKEVERKVVERVRLKAATFGQDITAAGPTDVQHSSNGGEGAREKRHKVRPEVVAQVYQDVVMPLTKEVEVLYLLRRLDEQ